MSKPMKERGWCALDIETGIKPAYGRKASPFYALNDIWAVGYGRGPAEQATGYHKLISGIPSDWFRRVLDDNKLIVGHNIKFDLLHILQDKENHTAWMQWVADGGQIFDTQLAEYLLQGQDTGFQMASLEDVSALYGGSMKDDAVKGAWVQGIDTGDIDPDVLMDYLLGTGEDNLGDIGNTALVFKAQFALAKERGQLQSIILNNGALLYCIEAELNGMYVDTSKGEVIRQKLVESLETLNAEVDSYLPKDIPFPFNWGSAPQKSALLFGGSITYPSREHATDENGAPLYAKKEETLYITNDGELVTEEWVQQDPSHSYKLVRFAGGARKGEAKTKKVKVDDHSKPKMTTVKRQYTFPGYVKPLPQWESKSTPGQYSTGSDVTDTLGTWADAPPFVKAYAERAKLSKDLGTYYWTEDPKTGERKGMLSLVGPDGVVHGQLNMVNTNTGRLSASSPNLQNLPKEGKSEVKTLFVSRFPGGSIAQSDFTALEVYVQANLSKDGNMIEDLRKGLDMHCVRVSQKEGVTYEYVVERAKDPNHPEHKVWAKKRSNAKGFSFQR